MRQIMTLTQFVTLANGWRMLKLKHQYLRENATCFINMITYYPRSGWMLWDGVTDIVLCKRKKTSNIMREVYLTSDKSYKMAHGAIGIPLADYAADTSADITPMVGPYWFPKLSDCATILGGKELRTGMKMPMPKYGADTLAIYKSLTNVLNITRGDMCIYDNYFMDRYFFGMPIKLNKLIMFTVRNYANDFEKDNRPDRHRDYLDSIQSWENIIV